MASKETEERLRQKYEAIAADRAEAAIIRDNAIAEGTWGVKGGTATTAKTTPVSTPEVPTTPAPATPTTPKPAAPVTQEKETPAEQQEEPKSAAERLKESEAAREKAQKDYDEYVKSDEHKKRLEEAANKAQIDRMAQATFNPNFDLMKPQVIEDEKEAQLRAAKEQAELDYNKYLDEQVAAADMAAITDLSDEERSQLEQYAVNRIRDQNQTLELQGRAPTAQQEAAALLQKYGQKRVDELAETLMRQQNTELAQTVDEKSREFANKHGFLGSVATIPVAAVSGLISTVGQLQGAARRTGRYHTLDANEIGTTGDVFTGAVRGQVQENIEQGLGGGLLGKAASIGYQVVMSSADSIARVYLGGGAIGGTGLAATNSFSQTMADASRNGATPQQAALLATVNSAIEAASEKIPLDKLIKIAGGKGAATVLKNALRQAGIEATTEEISLVCTVLAELAVMQEKSSYKQEVRDHILNGDSPEVARAKANITILKEVLNTALVSGGSGFLSGAGASKAQDIEAVVDRLLGDLGKPKQQEQQSAMEQQPVMEQQTQQPVEQQSAPVQETTEAAAQEPVMETPPVMQEQRQVPPSVPAQQQRPAQPMVENREQTYQQPEPVARPQETPAAAPEVPQQETRQEAPQETWEEKRRRYDNDRSTMPRSLQKALKSFQKTGFYTDPKLEKKAFNDPKTVAWLRERGLDPSDSWNMWDELDSGKYTIPGQATSAQGTQQQAVPEVSTQQEDTYTPVQPRASNVQGESVEGGQIKGTGAAERNFSGVAAYEDMLEEGNTQKERPWAVRDVEMPKTDSDGRRVTEFASNAVSAQVTPDPMADAIKSLVGDKQLSFDTRTNQQSLENAAEDITARGADTIRTEISKNAENGIVKDGDIEKGLVLYAEYANDPNRQDEAAGLLVDMAKLAHMSGRNLQLFSLMQRLTPEGKIKVLKKDIARSIKQINEGRSKNKQVDLSKPDVMRDKKTTSVVTNARKTTGDRIKRATDKVRYKSGRVEIESNQAGEPFVFEYAQKVGEALAKGLAPKPPRDIREKTYLETITGELRRFANEKMPQKQRGKSLTATELLRDYIQNEEFYREAWEAAQYELQKQHGDDPRLQEFLGSGIGVDANVNPANKIFTRALTAAAMESGETADVIRKQDALGFTNIADTIADKLISDTGATGEMADTIRDAARQYVNDIRVNTSDNAKSAEEIVTSSIGAAMRDNQSNMTAAAKGTAAQKAQARQTVIDSLIHKYGFGSADASRVSEIIGSRFDQLVEQQSQRILDQRFGNKKQPQQQSPGQMYQELENLGAFEEGQKYRGKAESRVLGASAKKSKETASTLRKQNALGFTNMDATIAEVLIKETGATGERARAIRDAASRYVDGILNEETEGGKTNDELVTTSIRSAMKDIEQTLSQVAKSGKQNKETVKKAITDKLVKKYGFGSADASRVANVVGEQFEKMTKDQARKILEQKFAERPERSRKTSRQVFEELANLGAFDVGSEYSDAASKKVLGDDVDVPIDEELAQKFIDAKTDKEKQAALDEIYKDVAAKIKPTIGEMYDAWRNLAMLGNVETHERNIFSTAAFQPYVEVKRAIGAALEKAAGIDQEKRTKAGLIGKEAKALLEWTKQDAKTDAVMDLMDFSGTTGNDARSAIQENRKILPGVLDKAAKKNMEIMEKSDMFFKKNEYARALASFLKARGYTAGDLQNGTVPKGVLDEGRQIAVKEAQKATFNDSNKFSDAIVKLGKPNTRDGWAVVNVVKKGMLPFLRTPANVVARAAEYNPLNGLVTLATAKKDIESGRRSTADVLDQISASLTGTAATAIGMLLGSGAIPGIELVGAIEDEDELREGAQEYSLKIGDNYYGVGWLAPAMIPLFLGANIVRNGIFKADENADAWDYAQAFVDLGLDTVEPILDLSMLSSLNDTIDKFANEEDPGDKAMAVLLNTATSYLQQGIPTLFGQLEQATEKEKSSTYVNTDNKLEKAIKTTIADATKRVPGVDLYQTKKLDEFGRPVKNEGDALTRAIDALFNPFSKSKVKDDALTREITRLNNSGKGLNATPDRADKVVSYTDTSGKTHADVRLTEEQYQKKAQTEGDTAKRILDEVIQSDVYKSMTDEQKAKVFDTVYDYASRVGLNAAVDDYDGFDN